MANINHLSEQLLLAVKKEEPINHLIEEIAHLDQVILAEQLIDDFSKIACWVNFYNAFFQILRKEYQLNRPHVFTKKVILIAGKRISLDTIEHGILRRYRFKYSLGFFADPFTNTITKKWAVDHIDYRIHFALNCGAKSCPPIAYYNKEHIHQQLEKAEMSFIENDTSINEEKRELNISRIYLWFLKDFGGANGIKKIISRQFDNDYTNYKLIYKPYSWEDHLNNYREEAFS